MDEATALCAFQEIIALCETCHTVGAALQALEVIHNVAKAVTDLDKSPVDVEIDVEIIDRPLTKEELMQKYNEAGL